jgi:hypothetical protein
MDTNPINTTLIVNMLRLDTQKTPHNLKIPISIYDLENKIVTHY